MSLFSIARESRTELDRLAFRKVSKNRSLLLHSLLVLARFKITISLEIACLKNNGGSHTVSTLPPVPVQIIGFPLTAYSICYDIFTRRNEDNAPNGWNSPRYKLIYLSGHVNVFKLILNIFSQDLQENETTPSQCRIYSRLVLELDTSVDHSRQRLQRDDRFGEHLAREQSSAQLCGDFA